MRQRWAALGHPGVAAETAEACLRRAEPQTLPSLAENHCLVPVAGLSHLDPSVAPLKPAGAAVLPV